MAYESPRFAAFRWFLRVVPCVLMWDAGVSYGADGKAVLEAVQIHSNFYVITGAGANIALQTGEDGTLLVDAGVLESSGSVVALIKTITDEPIRYVLDSSADADHVGGNGVRAKAGRSIFFTGPEPLGNAAGVSGGVGASILAPESVLLRVSAPSGQKPPFPSDVWPTEAFAESHRFIYFNREGIEIFQQAAHDDTDSIVFFRGSDVICAGETIDSNHFPVIDLAHGGSIQKEIESLNRIIALAVRPIPFVFGGGGTYIIPAHGRVHQYADVIDYRDMLVIIRDIVQDMMKRGMALAQIESAEPAKAFEREYGAQSGSWTTNDFISAVYQSLVKDKAVRGVH